jgi:DNA-binding SARP family transcriptional activator
LVDPAEDAHGLARVEGTFELSLLGSFRLSARDATVPLKRGSKRLLALLALRATRVERVAVAGTLWPDSSEERAGASLRSTLWRIRTKIPGAVEGDQGGLRLAPTVSVDIQQARVVAQSLLDLVVVDPPDIRCLPLLSGDLLPDWYDDWVLAEAEAWHQVRVHALEALCRLLLRRGRLLDALRVALAAVRAEPLRESARELLILVHLAEGNRSEALRELERYRSVLGTELGLEPTERLATLAGLEYAAPA